MVDPVIVLILAVFLGIVPGAIASSKGHSFAGWRFFGWMLFIAASPCACLRALRGVHCGRRSERRCLPYGGWG
jgi:hypothetical protein